jgi:hypothetical protein
MISASAFAQSNKKAKLNKGTSKREIRKRQEEAKKKQKENETNAFNELQPIGRKVTKQRDDILWGSETANTVYARAGNISLMTPSRYGIKQDIEISTVLSYAFWVPNVFVKKRWWDARFKIATRHGVYTATPGLNWAQKNGHYDYVDSLAGIPFVISLRNEVFFSYALYHDEGCIKRQPYIILTLSSGVDAGFALGDSAVNEIPKHFLANRSPSLTGSGVMGYTKARVDIKLYDYLYASTSMNFYYGKFTGNFAFENHTAIQTFITKSFSASVGFYFSLADYGIDSKAGIMPLIDLTWYFGQSDNRQKGLFQKRPF